MKRLLRGTRSTPHEAALQRGSHARLRLAASVALGLFALALLVGSDAPTQAAEPHASTAAMAPAKSPAPVSEAAQQRALDAYETLPLSFTANAGQTDERVRYGGTGSDVGNAIAADEKGRTAYLAGSTTSADYPTTAGARDKSHNGGSDAFVTALRTTGHGITNLGAR